MSARAIPSSSTYNEKKLIELYPIIDRTPPQNHRECSETELESELPEGVSTVKLAPCALRNLGMTIKPTWLSDARRAVPGRFPTATSADSLFVPDCQRVRPSLGPYTAGHSSRTAHSSKWRL